MQQSKSESPARSPGRGLVPLESVLCTEELKRRPARLPDYETENRVLVVLAQAVADSPGTILQMVADLMLEAFRADSAGLSVLSEDGKTFYWPAIAGMWKPHIGGGTPRDFGPCGDVLDRDAPLLFRHFERRYAYFLPVTPPVEECLLVPFYVAGKAIGTIWVIAHDARRKFDVEDLRQLESVGRFASAAHQAAKHLEVQRSRRVAALNLMEDAVVARQSMEKLVLELADGDSRKNEFLAMLGHELRNPLSALANGLDLLGNVLDNRAQAEELLGMMVRQTTRIATLLDQLLDIARVISGKVELLKGPVDLLEVVRVAVETMRSFVEARKHEVTVTLPSERSVFVLGDAVRLAQVVENILTNAVKYTAEGGRIEVVVDAADDVARIIVRDTGMGISPEFLPHVFEVFTQAPRTLDRAEGGLGLGLTLARRLIGMHGGDVSASSPGLGQGSEFTVTLPRVPERRSKERPERPPARIEPVRPRRILVVDDEKDSARSLAELLGFDGHRVLVVNDGPTALAAFRTFDPEVVLLDLGLPEMDGYMVARALRDEHGDKKFLLIAVTGYQSDAARLNQAGFDQHLLKPLSMRKLSGLLAAMDGGRQATESLA